MERVRRGRPEREREEDARVTPPAEAALLALQRGAGNHATAARVADLRSRRLQRQITLGVAPVNPDQAFEKVSPLLDPMLSSAQFRDIVNLIAGYDANNRVFADERALAAAIQVDIGAAFQATVRAETQTVLMLPDFRRLAGDYALPSSLQQEVAVAIESDAQRLEVIYAELAERVTHRRGSAESIMKWFTAETRDFVIRVIREGQATLPRNAQPKAPFAVVMAGSGAREEMFPSSDLDLSPVTQVDDNAGIEAVFSFMQYVEKRLKATMEYLRLRLGLPHEVGLGPDTGVFPFAKSPEELAQKALTMQNTGADATPIYASQGGAALPGRFEKARAREGTPKHALSELTTRLQEFPPIDLGGATHIDIKKNFLRFPTLALRDLAQFFQVSAASSFDRVRALVSEGYLDKAVGDGVLRALESIAAIRLRMHVHYHSENDKAATADAHKTTAGEYALSAEELRMLTDAQLAMALFRDALWAFVDSGGKSGLKKGFFESLW